MVVGLGKTYRPSEAEEWERRYFEVEFKIGEEATPEDFAAAKKAGIETILGWLNEPLAKSPLAELNPAELDKLPWKEYKAGHRNAWIFANTQGAEKLLDAIKSNANGRVEVGGFVYRLSGKERQFISRAVASEATQR